MCIMCIEIMKDRMSFQEATRALGEFHVSPEHEKELEAVILSKFTLKDIAESLGLDLEEAAEAMAELDFPHLGE